MSYDYKKEVAWVYTDEGQRQFLRIRDRAAKLVAESGAVTVGALMRGEIGDSFQMLACVDRLVELGEYRYLAVGGVTQHKVLV